jgi:hypothetical protein
MDQIEDLSYEEIIELFAAALGATVVFVKQPQYIEQREPWEDR